MLNLSEDTNKVTMPLKLSAVLPVTILGLGNLLHILGLNTSHWTRASHANFGEGNSGLWEYCLNGKCTPYPDWYSYQFQVKFCQFTAVIGMVMGVVALLMMLVANSAGVQGKDIARHLVVCKLGASAISCVMIISCLAAWTTFYQNNLDYSFYCSVAGAVLILIGGMFHKSPNRHNRLHVFM